MSIEDEHASKLKELNNKDKNIKILQKELIQKQNLKKNTLNWRDKIKIENSIADIENKISDLGDTSKTQYLLNVADVLEQYEQPTDKINKQSNEPFFSNSTTMKHYIQETKCHNKGELYKKYMNIVSDSALVSCKVNLYMCHRCNVTKIMLASEAIVVCPRCGDTETYFDSTSAGMTYEQEINSEVNISFSYKRINHFNESIKLLVTGSYFHLAAWCGR
jgi:rubrerythrin